LEAAYPELTASAFDIGPTCALFQVEPLPAETYEPVTSDTPTLVLNGRFDPITPPQYGEYVGSKLPNAFVYTSPREGHGSLLDNLCVGVMAASFLLDPGVAPDSSCLDSQEVEFAVQPIS
jgi:pimeloyl-ACP methyl ester carboxylesterase